MYALIYNNQIEVGPRSWIRSAFKDFLQEQNLDSSELPNEAPSESIITPEWKLLLVEPYDVPQYDLFSQQLAGPFLTIGETSVTGYYDVAPIPIEAIKNKMKYEVAANRYYAETKGVFFTFADGVKVKINTNRNERSIYLETYLSMKEDSSVYFKFPNEIFRTLTKPELSQIIDECSTWVQSTFNWEMEKFIEIDSAQTVEQLKTIQLNNQAWVD